FVIVTSPVYWLKRLPRKRFQLLATIAALLSPSQLGDISRVGLMLLHRSSRRSAIESPQRVARNTCLEEGQGSQALRETRGQKQKGKCQARQTGTRQKTAFATLQAQPLTTGSMLSSSSSSSLRFRWVQLILFSFLSLLRALANHVETCVRLILVMMASMIFSPLVGYGFFRCSLSQAFRVAVASRVAFFRYAGSPNVYGPRGPAYGR
ncbi:hypothetical protein DNTS_011944, partial [Danionella cerebrum]